MSDHACGHVANGGAHGRGPTGTDAGSAEGGGASVAQHRLVWPDSVHRAWPPTIRPVNHLVDHGDVIVRTHTGAAILRAIGQIVAYEADRVSEGPRLDWTVVVIGMARTASRRSPGSSGCRRAGHCGGERALRGLQRGTGRRARRSRDHTERQCCGEGGGGPTDHDGITVSSHAWRSAITSARLVSLTMSWRTPGQVFSVTFVSLALR